MTDVLPLDTATDHRLAGRKAATLALLREAGVRVPDGLVLPVGAPPSALEPFGDRVVALWPGPVAVRSSTVWEDHATGAHAGEGHTELGVEGAKAVADAARRCLAAPAGDGRAPGDGVAVLVQPLLAADHAGVAFGADPTTGERDVVRVQAVAGLGDRLVGGDVVGSDVTVRGRRVDGDRSGAPGLDDDAYRDVAAAVRTLGALRGGPQDVEWAIVDGEVHVLQARPISVLPVEPVLPTGNGWQKDVTHHTGPITPFGWWALNPSGTEGGAAGEVFARAGVLVDGLEMHVAGGEVYARPVPAVGPSDPGRMPPPPALLLGLVARLLPVLRERCRAAEAVVHGGRAEEWVTAWREDVRDRLLAVSARERAIDLPSLDDDALTGQLQRLRAATTEGGRVHFQVFIPYAMRIHALHALLAEHLDDWSVADTSALLTGSSPATRAAEASLADIRAAVTPTVADALRAAPDDPVGVLAAHDRAAATDLERWSADHAWRPTNSDAGASTLAEQPRLLTHRLLAGDGPATADLVAAAARAADEVRTRLPATTRARFATLLADARRVHPLREDTLVVGGEDLLGLLRRWLLEVGRRLNERGIIGSVRDAAYLDGDEVVAVLRGDMAAGEAQGRIVRRRGEEAWARANPGPRTIGHQGAPPDVSRLPSALRTVNEAMLWMMAQEFPTGDHARPTGDALVVGVGASAGMAEGPVRVVTDGRQLATVEPGDVLVCPVATPAWVAVLPLCAAVVADGGGALAHAAIAAREHGVPAVLGCGSATTVLEPGRLVRVDGAAGTVTAVAPSDRAGP